MRTLLSLLMALTLVLAAAPPPAHADSTVVAITIPATRILVVDERENLIGVWSNTPTCPYELKVKTPTLKGGQFREPSASILEQFREVEPQVDFAQPGVVWTAH